MSEDPLITLRRSAMNYLARREHSYHELKLKLEEKYPELNLNEQILPALDRLREEHLQSDERFLESYIRFRRNKGFGPLKIEAELYHKGLDSSEVKAALYNEEHDWSELCEQALSKRFALLGENSPKERLRQQRFLIQRGFSSEQIRAILKGK